jgi:hypothetical protein
MADNTVRLDLSAPTRENTGLLLIDKQTHHTSLGGNWSWEGSQLNDEGIRHIFTADSVTL